MKTRFVTLPNGATVDFDKLPRYSANLALSGVFCPYTNVPLDDSALGHFDDEGARPHRRGVDDIKRQLAEYGPPVEPSTAPDPVKSMDPRNASGVPTLPPAASNLKVKKGIRR